MKLLSRSTLILLGLEIIALIICVAIRFLYIPKANVLWDEALYHQWSYKIFESVKTRDTGSFLKASWDQIDKPPLQSWVVGIPLALTDTYSVMGARTINLIWTIIAVWFMYLLAGSVSTKYKISIQTFSVLLFVFSPFTLVFSSMLMKEIIGTAFTFLASYMYIHSTKKPLLFSLLTSLSLMLLAMSKISYSIIVVLAIMVNEIILFLPSKQKTYHIIRDIVLALPYSIAFFLWVIYPVFRLPMLMTTLLNSYPLTAGLGPWWDYLLFYPRGIVYIFSPSIVIGILILASWVLAIMHIKNNAIRFLWLVFTINFVFGVRQIFNIQERYLATTVPLLYVITSYIWTTIVTSLIKRENILIKTVTTIGLSSFVALVILDLAALPTYVYAVGAYTARTPLFNQKDYRDQWFDYNTATWPRQLPAKPFDVPQDVYHRIAKFVDLSKPIAVYGEANEFSIPYTDVMINLERIKQAVKPMDLYPSYIAVIIVLPTSRFYTRDFIKVNLNRIGDLRWSFYDPTLTLIDDYTFQEMGVELAIFGRNQ